MSRNPLPTTLGIRCPETDCGTHLSDVTRTVRANGFVYRTRRCYNGHAFCTRESICSQDEFLAVQRKLDTGRKRLVRRKQKSALTAK